MMLFCVSAEKSRPYFFLEKVAEYIMNLFKRGIEALRQPDRNPRCYELTDDERIKRIREWNNRNVWNTPELTKIDVDTYYGK